MSQNKTKPSRFNDYNLDLFNSGQTDDQCVDNLHLSNDEFSQKQ